MAALGYQRSNRVAFPDGRLTSESRGFYPRSRLIDGFAGSRRWRDDSQRPL